MDEITDEENLNEDDLDEDIKYDVGGQQKLHYVQNVNNTEEGGNVEKQHYEDGEKEKYQNVHKIKIINLAGKKCIQSTQNHINP